MNPIYRMKNGYEIDLDKIVLITNYHKQEFTVVMQLSNPISFFIDPFNCDVGSCETEVILEETYLDLIQTWFNYRGDNNEVLRGPL